MSPTLANLITPRTSRGAAVDHTKMKLLIVDDEPLNIALLERVLSDSGYTHVQAIQDSRLALETIENFEPDLVLLDLMMPHVDGFALLEQLRSRGDDTFLPVIVLTADANSETRLRALRAGATDFLLKPFDLVEVLLRIGNLLEMRRLHVQLEMQRAAFEEAVRDRTSELRDTQLELQRALSHGTAAEVSDCLH
ncbi:MAG: response regulator [Verrucomicrobiota bacterium]|nr:response regulator [Verrucomicrobiota bacterium]